MSEQTAFPARPPRQSWTFSVAAARDVSPRLREVSLVGDNLAAFSYRPGQDVVLNIPVDADRAARRHYTIRRYDRDAQRLDIQFVLHGVSPATQWARDARAGDPILAEGPRGRTVVSGEADWRLFTGDETALPGIAAMIESLPAGERAFAIIEIGDREDEQAIETAARLDVTWLHRGGAPTAPSQALIEALAAFDLPAGPAQACIIGETATVRAQRQSLIARGFPKDRIAAEGYWRPGRVGGHDHVVDADQLAAFGRGRGEGGRPAYGR